MAFTYPTMTQVLRTDTFDVWADKTNKIKDHSSYLQSLLGNFNDLSTASKNVVGGINELYSTINENTDKIGNLQSIDSNIGNNFTTLVSGINSLYDVIKSDIASEVDDLNNERNALNSTLSNKISVTNASVGLNGNGGYVAPVNSNYLGSTTTLLGAVSAIDLKLSQEEDRLDNIISSIGALSNGNISLSGNYISGSILDSLSLLDGQVKNVKDTLSTTGVNIGQITTKISTAFTNLGFTANGEYKSDTSNVYARSNQLKGDIAAVDFRLRSITTELSSLSTGNTAILDELDTKLDVDALPTGGNSWIIYSASNNTYSHLVTNVGSRTTTGTQVISSITLDSAGHITATGVRNLGNQALSNQTISSALPSGGNNGDVWYRI